MVVFGGGCDESEQSNDSDSIDTAGYVVQTPYVIGVPSHFPALKSPKDNPLTVEKVELGKRLFFDRSLSIDSSVSCASCHHPNKAFSDTTALSSGSLSRETERNSPSLMNIAFHPVLMREGAVQNLEIQVLSPLEGETEMAHNVVLACERLNRDSGYVKAFTNAFGDKATPFTITRALAAYERTLIGGDAPYDAYLLGDSSILSEEQIRGLSLFKSNRLGCTNCHSGVLFTNFEIANNGLYSKYTDPGLFRLTVQNEDRGKFKTPSLRNVAITAPYMHDGSLTSLDDVLEHYASGGAGHENQSNHIKGFKLTNKERKAIIAFFDALTESAID